jgi:formylmethanofuran dehydrogenase subunit B
LDAHWGTVHIQPREGVGVELTTLEAFEAAVRGRGAIVIFDGANGSKAHGTDCVFVSAAHFMRKVVENDRRNGRYFIVADADEARRVHRAIPCGVCKPS